MRPVLKTRDKAEAEQQQRRHHWAMTPYERLTLAARLIAQARALAAVNQAKAAPPEHGKTVLKSAAPIPRTGR